MKLRDKHYIQLACRSYKQQKRFKWVTPTKAKEAEKLKQMDWKRMQRRQKLKKNPILSLNNVEPGEDPTLAKHSKNKHYLKSSIFNQDQYWGDKFDDQHDHFEKDEPEEDKKVSNAFGKKRIRKQAERYKAQMIEKSTDTAYTRPDGTQTPWLPQENIPNLKVMRLVHQMHRFKPDIWTVPKLSVNMGISVEQIKRYIQNVDTEKQIEAHFYAERKKLIGVKEPEDKKELAKFRRRLRFLPDDTSRIDMSFFKKFDEDNESNDVQGQFKERWAEDKKDTKNGDEFEAGKNEFYAKTNEEDFKAVEFDFEDLNQNPSVTTDNFDENYEQNIVEDNPIDLKNDTRNKEFSDKEGEDDENAVLNFDGKETEKKTDANENAQRDSDQEVRKVSPLEDYLNDDLHRQIEHIFSIGESEKPFYYPTKVYMTEVFNKRTGSFEMKRKMMLFGSTDDETLRKDVGSKVPKLTRRKVPKRGPGSGKFIDVPQTHRLKGPMSIVDISRISSYKSTDMNVPIKIRDADGKLREPNLLEYIQIRKREVNDGLRKKFSPY